MMESHLQPQQREVERLQNIIDVLLEQNAQLKQSLCRYRRFVNSLETPLGDSIGPSGKTKTLICHSGLESGSVKTNFCLTGLENEGVKQEFCGSVLESGGVNTNFCNTRSKSGGVNMNFCSAGLQSGEGKIRCCLSSLESDGVNPFFHHTEPINDGIKQGPGGTNYNANATGIENSCTREAGSTAVLSSSALCPANNAVKTLENSAGNVNNSLAQQSNGAVGEGAKPKEIKLTTLEAKLRSVTPKSNYYGNFNAALILMQLKKSPKQSLKDLQALTGLSEDGIVKRIMKMKQQGLVFRKPGSHQLFLTEKAEQLIAGSME